MELSTPGETEPCSFAFGDTVFQMPFRLNRVVVTMTGELALAGSGARFEFDGGAALAGAREISVGTEGAGKLSIL